MAALQLDHDVCSPKHPRRMDLYDSYRRFMRRRFSVCARLALLAPRAAAFRPPRSEAPQGEGS